MIEYLSLVVGAILCEETWKQVIRLIDQLPKECNVRTRLDDCDVASVWIIGSKGQQLCSDPRMTKHLD